MIWLGPDQLNQLGVSRGMLVRNRALWTWRETGRTGRNGKPVRECQLESMGQTWIEKWLAQQPSLDRSLTTEIQMSHPVREPDGDGLGEQGTWETSGAEDRLTQALKRYDLGVRDAFLAESQRLASIVEQFDSIKPKQIKNADGRMVNVAELDRLIASTPCTDPHVLAIEPSRSKQRSLRTLYVWSKDFEVDGLAAFLRKPPESTGKPDKRKAEISAAAAEWVNANWRKTPSAERLWKDCKKQAKKHGWTIPARGWFYRKYQAIDKVTKTLVFEGQKAYTSRFAPYVPRDYRDLAALQVLCGDHSVRDVTVMLDDGSLTRPWLTLWQDLRTGLLWGWHLDLVPSSVTIGLAYANGVQTFGAQPVANPDAEFYSYLYTDQGRDYKCKQIAGQTLDFQTVSYGKAATIGGTLNALCTQRRVGLIEDLGLIHKMARGYNAREKFIERTHKDISSWEQNTFENEYCGRGIGHKPERWKAAWERHAKLRKRVGKNLDWLQNESPFMTLDDYRDNLAGWINEYNHTEHTRVVLGGATVVPIDEYERLYTRVEISDATLAMLLMRSDTRVIGKNGINMLQPGWHFLSPELKQFTGAKVEVRWTDADYDRIYVVLPDKRIVEAERLESSSILNPSKRTVAMVNRQKAHEQKNARDYLLVQQSNWRGETVEDRVKAMLGAEDETPEPQAQKMAVNARPTIHAFNRFDRLEKGLSRSSVTADDVAKANVIEGMFGVERAEKKRIKDEWED